MPNNNTSFNIDVTPVASWESTLEKTGELTPEIVADIMQTHGDRGERGIQGVSEHRVKHYRDFLVVIGRSDEHVIEHGFCDCPDTKYNLRSDIDTDLCWHAIAARIAIRIGEVDQRDRYYSELSDAFEFTINPNPDSDVF
jgi:predicted nucleic acid-binding Zn finger protein